MSKDGAKINEKMLMLEKDQAPRIGECSNQSQTRKLLIADTKQNIPDLNKEPCSEPEGEEKADMEAKTETLIALKPQDANDVSPKLLYELKVEIFARVSCCEYSKLQFLDKRFLHLLRSREIFRVRQEREIVKPYVFIRPSGDNRWTMFDKKFQNFKKLPEVPSDFCFIYGDKETICAGTHLLVVGVETEGIVVWRYELEMQKWFKGPAMITPRVMYGSASRGNDAFFAGGIMTNEKKIPEVVSIAEKYNAETKTWKMIHAMHKRRKFCSGCFLQGKFYVIGGRDENDEHLTCGESYDEVTNSWKLIPDMLKDQTFMSLQSPPLIAVVNESLYLLDTYLNELRTYDIDTNNWKKLGTVPVRADSVGGWGVAFKSLGDRLLVIGALHVRSMCENMSVYTCRPTQNVEELIWEKSNNFGRRAEFDHFIHNCCVMFA